MRNIPDIISSLFDDQPNVSQAVISSALGIITDSSRFSQLAVVSRRSETFLTWPTGLSKQPEDFVNKGLFYTGG